MSRRNQSTARLAQATQPEVRYNNQHIAHIKKVHSESITNAFQSKLSVQAQLERVRINGAMKQVIVKITYS